jgi:hypothetical protein
MKLGDMTIMVKNRIRVEFDDLSERELNLLARLYIMSVATAAVKMGEVSRHLCGFAHDFLCTPGRHEFVAQWEVALLTDLEGIIEAKRDEAKREDTREQASIPEFGSMKEFIGAITEAIKAGGGRDVKVMTREDAIAAGLLPKDWVPPADPQPGGRRRGPKGRKP